MKGETPDQFVSRAHHDSFYTHQDTESRSVRRKNVSAETDAHRWRRSLTWRPPQMPNRSEIIEAWETHSRRTGQFRQIFLAVREDWPRSGYQRLTHSETVVVSGRRAGLQPRDGSSIHEARGPGPGAWSGVERPDRQLGPGLRVATVDSEGELLDQVVVGPDDAVQGVSDVLAQLVDVDASRGLLKNSMCTQNLASSGSAGARPRSRTYWAKAFSAT